MTETNGDDPLPAAANDDAPGPEEANQAPCLDDACAEAGFDGRCCDAAGALCPFHAAHFHAPDYPCRDMLRHQLALEFLEGLARGAFSSSAPHRGPP